MNKGNSFDQFLHAARQADPNNSVFSPSMPHGENAVLGLSPFAPMFTPSMSPLNFPPPPFDEFCPQQGEASALHNFPGDFYRDNPPPSMPVHSFQFPRRRGGGIHNQQFEQPVVTQQFMPDLKNGNFYPNPEEELGYEASEQEPGLPNNFHQRRGQERWRGQSRGRGHRFDHFGQKRVSHSMQYPSIVQKPRQQQPSHSSFRHSKNDYGDLLYSHADLARADNRASRVNGAYSQSVPSDSRTMSDSRGFQRVYVRKVDQLNNYRQGDETALNMSKNYHTDSQQNKSNYTYRKYAVQTEKSSSNFADFQSRRSSRSTFSGKNSGDHMGKMEGEDTDRRVEMEDQLKRERYECMVCCDNIRQEASVWSCLTCYHVFHLRCITQWVKSSKEAADDIWRCPACQFINTGSPQGYRCFCGKVRDPKYIPGETPHSCGELCGRKGKEGCTHKCTLLCHPGPCPPCNAVVQRTCLCGSQRKSLRCEQSAVFRCDKECGTTLNCGLHKCKVICHDGDCLPCSVAVEQVCYGGHQVREVLCGSAEALIVSFSCEQMCSKNLACGNHVCEDTCHPGDCGQCPLLPEQVTCCCCGHTPLANLSMAPRASCLDPLPTCDKVCSKPMNCGPADNPHFCSKTCHEGPCGQCEGFTTVTCVCGANKKDFPCSRLPEFTATEPFKCARRCNRKRLCGRHKCNELCCTRDVHICEVVCGHILNCGQHKCEQLCHKGNCRPCLQASFEELTCYCGSEVLYPPVPCGTKPPSCHRICTRTHACQHPVRHTCHSDEACPPCTELVQKPCMGDHELRKNVPCYMTDISCGRPCGKPLPCGQHKCIKTCHKGPCLTEEETCSQPCRKKRKDCDHPCGAACHANTMQCPQTSCRSQMEIKCACGQRTSRVQCQAGSNMSAEIAQFQRLTVQTMASGGTGQEVDMSQLTVQKKNTMRQLECDSSCAMLERNRRLALALEIQNPDLDSKLSGSKYSDFLKESAKKYPAFVAKVEKSFADLVQSAKQSKQPSRSYAFPSMNREQRRVVHEMAEAYGCDTQSYDYEPNKNVVATAIKSKSWIPTVTLTASISRAKTAPPPIPHSKTASAWGTEGKMASSMFREKEKTNDKPEIDYFDFSFK